MPMRILVPLDGSRFSEQALASAYKVALLSRASVHLARVLRLDGPTASGGGFAKDAISVRKEEAEQYLDFHAALAPVSLTMRTIVLAGPGPISEMLARYIAQEEIDLVVMSTHGRTGLGRLWSGSEADSLLHNVKVPILLLRPHNGEMGPEMERWDARRILIPLDGSERAEAALEAAVELGWLTGARYTLLQIVPPPMLETYADVVAAQVDEHEILHELELAHQYLDGVADRLRRLGLKTDTAAVMHSNVAQGILHYAVENDVDMVALATHGRSGWSRLALGSVTQDLLHSARLPVLVIRSVETEVDVSHASFTTAAC